MAKQSKFKIQRQLGVELPGFGDKGAKGPLAKRAYPPGFHGPNRRRKISEYGIRLREKQKLRFHYGIKEKVLLNYVKKAKKRSNRWFKELSSMLERRLDNVVFRLGFLPTMASARQFVGHGHVLVDGKRVDIASYILKPGQVVSLKPSSYKNILVEQTIKEPTLQLPEYLTVETVDGNPVGRVADFPNSSHIPFELDNQHVIEYYGRV